MDFGTCVELIAKFCHLSISWTGWVEAHAHGDDLHAVNKVLREAPLAVVGPPAMVQPIVKYTACPRMADRPPGPLIDTWLWTLARAGRIASPLAPSNQIVVKGDGLADKASLYHLSFVVSDDPRRMSNFAHRLLLVGSLKENNQWHCLILAATLARTNQAAVARGLALVHAGDWVCMKSLARGLCHNPGGFALKGPNARMLAAPPHLPATMCLLTPLFRPCRPCKGRAIGLHRHPCVPPQPSPPQVLAGACGTGRARRQTFASRIAH